jgi:2'-phosphotransferase
MNTKIDKVRVSKEFCKILRHDLGPLAIRPDGFVSVTSILSQPFFKRNGVDVQFVRMMVEEDEKTRFTLKEECGMSYIRANQGHSRAVAAKLDPKLFLRVLSSPDEIPTAIHGTNMSAWMKFINAEGLKPMKRSHIHLAPGILGEEGVRSGMRASADVYIFLDTEKAMRDGMKFYMSENNVILTEGLNGFISPKYFSRVEDRKTGKVLFSNA